MRIDAAQMDRYRAAVSAQQEQARVFVESSIRQYAAANPSATVADMREYGIQVLEQAMRVYGDIACAAACMEYDAIARDLGYDLEPAEMFNYIDRDGIERDARYLVRFAGEGGVEEYARRMASKAYDHARFSANRTMAGNADRPGDHEAGMRFARVPSGRETCGFCLMLSAQGFVYTSKEAAGDIGLPFNSYHSNCDCTVMAGTEGAVIGGYDPDWLNEVYQDARSAVEPGAYEDWKAEGGEGGTGKSYDEYLRDRIAKEIETRDREWAWTGKEPEITMEPGARPLQKELDTATRLQSHGFSVRFRATRSSEAKRTSDTYFVLTDLEGNETLSRWGFKAPTGNGKQTIAHQFEEAAGQSHNLVIDATGLGDYWTHERLSAEVQRKLNREHTVQRGSKKGESWTFDQCLIIDGDGFGSTLIRKRRG